MKKRLFDNAVLAVLLLTLFSSCIKQEAETFNGTYDNVLIICTVAYNNLSSDTKRNISDVCDSPLPMKDGRRAVVVFAHNSVTDSDFSTPTNPCIFRIYADWSGNAVMDTLKKFSPDAMMTDAQTLRDGLQFIKESFPSSRYGLIYSSHGTGWLPSRYYDKVEPSPMGLRKMARNEPKVKSIGCIGKRNGGVTDVYETELRDFSQALPMHLNYLILDACLMGGIETAYELKDVADEIVFSQSEILSTGFDYKRVSVRLLQPSDPDARGFAEDYYNYYNSQSGSRRSAAISVIRTSELRNLAAVCKDIFAKYRDNFDSLSPAPIQYYFRRGKHYFYDLGDVVAHAGLSTEDKARFDDALAKCVRYKAATESILSEIPVHTHSGFSTYLPSAVTATEHIELDSYYSSYAWNKDTGYLNY